MNGIKFKLISYEYTTFFKQRELPFPQAYGNRLSFLLRRRRRFLCFSMSALDIFLASGFGKIVESKGLYFSLAWTSTSDPSTLSDA